MTIQKATTCEETARRDFLGNFHKDDMQMVLEITATDNAITINDITRNLANQWVENTIEYYPAS